MLIFGVYNWTFFSDTIVQSIQLVQKRKNMPPPAFKPPRPASKSQDNHSEGDTTPKPEPWKKAQESSSQGDRAQGWLLRKVEQKNSSQGSEELSNSQPEEGFSSSQGKEKPKGWLVALAKKLSVSEEDSLSQAQEILSQGDRAPGWFLRKLNQKSSSQGSEELCNTQPEEGFSSSQVQIENSDEEQM